MFVANFTPDAVEWMHVGQTGTLEPGDVIEFDDARGKHILNKWGARGLLRMTYEDKDMEDEKRVEAMKIYTKFWENQIGYFNRQNMARKNEQKPYLPPSKDLEEKAAELKIELETPWAATRQSDPKEVEELKGEVEALKGMLQDLLQGVQAKPEAKEPNVESIYIEQFNHLEAGAFKLWVEANLSNIRHWPESVQTLIEVKWDQTQGGEPYPLEA